MIKKLKTILPKKKTKEGKREKTYLHYYLGFFIVIILTCGPYLFYNLSYKGRVYPNIFVDGVHIGGYSQTEALEVLTDKFEHPEKITLKHKEKTFDLSTEDIDVSYDLDHSVLRAYNFPRTGNPFYDTAKRIELLKGPVHLGLLLTIDEQKLSKFFDEISKQVDVKPIYPSIKLVQSSVEVERGTPGEVIDRQSLRDQIALSLSNASQDPINIPVVLTDPTLNDRQVEAAKTRGEGFLGKTLAAKVEYTEFVFKGYDLLKFINPKGGFNDEEITDAIYKIASAINRDPQNPKFQFDGSKVVEFVPALDGIRVNSEKLKEDLLSKLTFIEQNSDKAVLLEIPVIRTKPQVSTDKVNNLGIKEMIGRGTSTYFHSIPGRVFNVNLAASRINGTLIPPGETFSFTQTLGDVSKLTGYKEAYVISGGKTILGDGGGVCQVSTTLFRAVLNAGLPVNERTAHAYRVGYYEQDSPPGLDATVYYPRPDFKFTNDTGSHILVVVKNDPKKSALVFELYGTNDGRVATVSKPVISNVTAALPTVYQDDPTLPVGTTKQVDYAAKGARVTFDYRVVRGGQEIYKRSFVSNYQPWAAVYLRGSKTQ
jgi:vancomycin resistance protein YoaR